MNTKLTFAIAATVLGTLNTVPYIINIFRHKTTPHSYSWLVWTILQITGALAMLGGGAGGIGVVYLSVGAVLCLFVLLLSLRYGTKNITAFDKVCLVGALTATAIWFFLRQPLLSVIFVAVIDFVAFLPTFRKAYEEPCSETVSMYFLSGVAQLLALVALSAYNVSTTLYLIALAITNMVFTTMVLLRRARLSSSLPK
jgi:hypothetical protein